MEKRQRRRHGSSTDYVALNTRLAPESKAKIDQLADLRRISQARALDVILECVELNRTGDLVWADHASQHAPQDQEVLPLNKSA